MAQLKSIRKKKLSPKEQADKDRRRAEEILQTYRHSSRSLHKSIIAALPPLSNDDSNDDKAPVKLIIKAGDIMDALADNFPCWAISQHWLYTTCNPNITDEHNAAYSPVYQQYAMAFPSDHFGELARLDDDGEALVPHGDKLVADSRYVDGNTWDYGSAWDDDGNVIKTDANGHPVLDGWMGSLADRIDELAAASVKQQTRRHHFRAFLIGGTRDDMAIKRDAIVIHKPAHAHIAIELPRPRSRYQMMAAFGVNFDDYARTFNWIADQGDQPARVESFLDSLAGVIKNYVVPEHWNASLRYLVHQSDGAIKDQKATYRVAEVTSWLPDDKSEDYAHYAGVYDNTIPAVGINNDVIRNLHTPYNVAHHTADVVGIKADNKQFTYSMLRDVRSIVTHARGSNSLSRKTLEMLPTMIMRLIRTNAITVGDWPQLIHAALDDEDADQLLGNQRWSDKMDALINREIKAVVGDPSYDRHMLTTIITAPTGGIGKTYLANLLARYYDHGRAPHMSAAKDKDKTYDAYGNYANQLSSIIDEDDPSAISWSQRKDLLDPNKLPDVSSRYTNKVPWAVHHTFITQVYPGGVAQYVRQILRYAPGVGSLGYLIKSDPKNNSSWELAKTPAGAQAYLSNLSQLLRRLPVWVELSPTDSGTGTNIKVSVLAYNPDGGRRLTHYDYCHNAQSCQRINTILAEDTPSEVAQRAAKKIADMIATIREQAQAVFAADPTVWLPDCDGWEADGCQFGVVVVNGNKPKLVDVDDPSEADQELIEASKLTLNDAKILIRRYLHYDFVVLGFDVAVDGKGEAKRFDLGAYCERRDQVRDKVLHLFPSSDAFDSFVDNYRQLMIDNFVLLPEDMTTTAAYRHNEVDKFGRITTAKASVN